MYVCLHVCYMCHNSCVEVMTTSGVSPFLPCLRQSLLSACTVCIRLAGLQVSTDCP